MKLFLSLIASLAISSFAHATPTVYKSLKVEFYSDADDTVKVQDYAKPTNSVSRDGLAWNSDYYATTSGGKLSYSLDFGSGVKRTLDVTGSYTDSKGKTVASNAYQDINVTWGGLGVKNGTEELNYKEKLTLSFDDKVKLNSFLLSEHYTSYAGEKFKISLSVDGGAAQVFSGSLAKVDSHAEFLLDASKGFAGLSGKTFTLSNLEINGCATSEFYVGALNVSAAVAAVPEPESYAMLLGGLGLLGALVRRRTRQAA